MAGPSKVLAVYWPWWGAPGPITNVDTDYNVIFPFAAVPSDGTAAQLRWPGSTIVGLQEARARGQKVVLSTGGAGAGINFSSRTVSQQFVASFQNIASAMGGVDGIDFNTFEADAVPNTTEYLWMAQEFKRIYGPNFIVTSPPAPWRETDKAFCKTMLAAGAMDFAGPQYYDGPGLAEKSYVVNSVREWVRDVAGGDASKIVVGFGVQPGQPNYMTVPVALDTYKTIKAEFPNIRGAFLWERAADAAAGWPFANQMGPIVQAGATTPTPTPTPPPSTDNLVKIGSASFPSSGTNVARPAESLVVFTRTSSQTVSPANQWGAEAAITDGKVTQVVNRENGAPALTIPVNGAVISGHGAARDWIMNNAKVGATVTGPGIPAAPAPTPTPTPEPTPTPPAPAPNPTLPQPLATSATLGQVISSHNDLLAYLKSKNV